MMADDSSESNDLDIDDLLDGAASTQEDASDESEAFGDSDGGDSPAPDDPSPTDEDAPAEERDEDIEDSDSWVEIMDPLDPSSEGDRLYRVWGRFWGEFEDIAAAFYLIVDPASQSIVTLRLAVYGNPELLEDFHPRMEGEQFEHRLVEYNVQGEAIPKVIFEEVREGFEEYFHEENGVQILGSAFEDDNAGILHQWANNLFSGIIEEGGALYQLRGQEVPVGFEDEEAQSTTTTSDQTGTTEKDRSESEESDTNRLDVSVINNPSSGMPAAQLEEGEQLFVRIVDDRVEQLPQSMIESDRSKPVSIPIQATVKSITPVSELPERIADGDPGEYRKVIVDLQESFEGAALIYLEDRLKTEESSDTDSSDDEVLYLLLFGGVLILIVILVFMS